MVEALVAFESYFGRTQEIAEAVTAGLVRARVFARSCRFDSLTADALEGVDLIVAGAPTHGRTVPSDRSRAEAAAWAHDPKRGISLVVDPPIIGLREWSASPTAAAYDGYFAAFDTRSSLPRMLSGSASVRIARDLRAGGMTQLTTPRSFRVTRNNTLSAPTLVSASDWGFELGKALLRDVADGRRRPAPSQG